MDAYSCTHGMGSVLPKIKRKSRLVPQFVKISIYRKSYNQHLQTGHVKIHTVWNEYTKDALRIKMRHVQLLVLAYMLYNIFFVFWSPKSTSTVLL